MLKFAEGNILDMAEDGQFDVVVQGCNCFNTMGGGIARQIADRYPEVEEVDSQTTVGDIGKLGNYTFSNVNGHSFSIVNAYTQYGFSRGEDVFEYESFAVILRKLAVKLKGLRIGLPRIGQGLARGNPVVINKIIEEFSKQMEETGSSVTIVDFVENKVK